MRQVLGAGALGRPRGIWWRGRWEGGSRWRTHVYPWLIHVNVWQKPLQYCKVISLQLIKKKKERKKITQSNVSFHLNPLLGYPSQCPSTRYDCKPGFWLMCSWAEVLFTASKPGPFKSFMGSSTYCFFCHLLDRDEWRLQGLGGYRPLQRKSQDFWAHEDEPTLLAYCQPPSE